ncbi:MAG: TetR/AcrR family transcriptional regulator [Myxococcota bacterium]
MPTDDDAPAVPRTARGRRTRQRLLDAAEIEFGRRGFADASIVDITRRAEVAQGTFYTYFPSKEAIFAELVRALSHLLRQEIATAVSGLATRDEIERVGLGTFLAFVRQHRDLYRIVRQAEFVDPALFRWYYERMAEGYVRGLTAAAGRGEVATPDVEAAAWALMGMADFLGMRWVLWPAGEDEPPPVPQSVVDAAMAILRGGLLR